MNAPSAPEGSAIQDLFDRLKAAGMEYGGAEGVGGNWQCPAHDDHTPSLHVEVGDSADVVCICRSCGASLPAVLDALVARNASVVGGKKLVPVTQQLQGRRAEPDEVDWGDVQAKNTGHGSGRSSALGKYLDTWIWDYLDRDGSPVRRVSRANYTQGKQIVQLSPFVSRKTGYQTWTAGVKDVRVTPLNYELFDGWIEDGKRGLYVCEGEKATDALIDAGQAATTYPGGSGGKLPKAEEVRDHFKGFNKFRVWADADEAGLKRAFRVADLLDEAFPDAKVSVVMNAGEVHKGDDAADLDDLDDIKEKTVSIETVEEGLAALASAPEPEEPEPEPGLSNLLWYSHSRLAEAVPAELQQKGIHLRWSPEGTKAGTWRKFTPSGWEIVGEEAVWEILREHFNEKWERSAHLLVNMNAQEASKFRTVFKTLLSRTTICEVERLMRGVKEVHTASARFDNNPSVLNTPSGLVDLTAHPDEAGLRSLTPNDLISKITRVSYRHHIHRGGGGKKYAKAREYVEKVNAAMQDDQLDYVLDRLGMNLFGEPNNDDKIVTGHGGGENGKTTFTNLYFDNALGVGEDHYANALSTDILAGVRGTHPEMLLQLKGFRIGLLNEPVAVAESRVKEVTDNIIKAREMFGFRTSFRNTCSIWVTSNHTDPSGYDGGSLRRYEAVSFPYYFGDDELVVSKYGEEFARPGDSKVRHLAEKNRYMGEVALADLVERARRWNQRGKNDKVIKEPLSVAAYTREQTIGDDILYEFFDAGPFEPGAPDDEVPLDNFTGNRNKEGVWQEFVEFAGDDYRNVAKSHLSFRKAVNKHHGLPYPLIVERAKRGPHRDKMVFTHLRRRQETEPW